MDLQTWNKVLFERLREDADARRLVHVYLDRDALADASGIREPAAAVEDFTSAFLAASGQRPFARALSEARAWERAGRMGDPPMVAALGMTVLAVTEDPLGASHNVYSRQNDLLHLPQEGGAPPGYTADVPALWKMWNEWLVTDGAWLGRPSASAGEHFVYQGWARSQGLIRARDRTLMAEYFSEIRPDALVGLAPDLQAREFIAWLSYRGSRTLQLRNRLKEDSACQILSTVLADELELWLQGTRRVRTNGRSAVPALLFYDEWADDLDLALEVDEQILGAPVDLGEGPVTVAADEPVRVLTTGRSNELLLGTTAQRWGLREGLVIQTRPRLAYVFREDTQLGGRIEVRGDAAAEDYFVLVHDAISDEVREALGLPSSSATPGPAQGWSWLKSPSLTTAHGNLRVLGLGSLVRPQSNVMGLQGGLRLTGQTYLSGGAPEVYVPSGHDTRYDGRQFSDGVSGPVVLRGAEAGAHVLEDRTTGSTIRFEVVHPSRTRARGSEREWPPTTQDRPDGGLAPIISGAAVTGSDPGAAALVADFRPGDRVLVVDDEGGMFEVDPPRERWLVRAEIDSYLIDVFRTVRTMSPRPAFVLVCSSRDRVAAIEVPRESRLSAGSVPRTSVPDLRYLLYGAWSWIGRPAEGRRRSVLSGLVQLGAGASTRSRRRSQQSPLPVITPRDDLVDEPIEGNPYDVILAWLSELEHPRVGIERFVATWRWACARSGHSGLGDSWRVALIRLQLLGHVERDFERRAVRAAQPTLALLPSSAGLRVLAGARPSVVSGWIDRPDEAPGTIGDALMNLMTIVKTQVEAGTQRPLGPTVLYVVTSAGKEESAAEGMRELGLLIPDWPSSTAILHTSTGIADIQRNGRVLEIPPARQSQIWRAGLELGGRGAWVNSPSDAGRGFYSYVTSSRKTMHAWRLGIGAPLIELPERNWGFWFEEHLAGRLDRIRFNEGKRLLFVRTRVPLPHLIERALVLRTGLLPGNSRIRDADYSVFENVDRDFAAQVASLLGQQLQDTGHEEST